MEKFNQNLQQFLNNIKLVVPESIEIIDSTYHFGDEDIKYITDFYANIYPLRHALSNCDEILFSADNVILENINFNTLWNDNHTDNTVKENIWKYLHTLYLFAYEYKNKIVLTDTLKRLKKLSKEDKLENISGDELILINIINKLSDQKSEVIKTLQTDKVEAVHSDNSFVPPEIFNGVIGDLAQEIAQEIDPSTLNLDDPSKLIKTLLSGNLDADNDTTGISALIKNISGKIKSKIDSGSLNPDMMMGEAQNVMNSLTSNGSLGDLSNLMGGAGGIPNLEGLMSGMSNLFESGGDVDGMGGEGGMPDLDKLFSGLMTKSNLNKTAVKSAQNKTLMKNKLRTKLKQKRELLKQQELLLNTNSITENFIEKDLDTLVKEIETAGEQHKKQKKKKKKKNRKLELV